MFIYDKDMERVMMAKKKEVLQEIETAKLRVLKELYCIKRGIHTDMCEMLADYNRIDFNLKKAIKDAETKLETTVKKFQKIIADALEEHNRTIETKLNELSALQSSVISEVNAALADLDALKTTIEILIAQCQEMIDNGVTQEDLDALRTEIEAALETAGVQSDWNESDETSKAFVKNRTHWAERTTENVTDVFQLTPTYGVTQPTYSNYENRYLYKLPETVDLSSYGSLIVTVNGVDYYVTKKKVSKLIYTYTDNQNRYFTFTENVDCFGDTNTVTFLFNQSIDYGEFPFCIYKNPNDSKWYIAPHHLGKGSDFGFTYQIKAVSENNVKCLDPIFMGGTGANGQVLTISNNGAKWENLELSNYTETLVKKVFDKHFNFVSSDGTEATFTVSKSFSDSMNVVSGKYYYLNVGKRCDYIAAEGNNDFFLSSNFRVLFKPNDYTGEVKVNLNSKFLPDDYETNGIDVSIIDYSVVEHNGLLNAEKLVIVSPNGTHYKLNISDDGVLSATAVTE